MCKKITLMRQYDPFLTGWIDTMIFAVVLWFLGVFWAKQDPAGTLLYCGLGIGIMMGLCIGGFYSSCYKSDWIDKCPYTRYTLKVWKWSAEDAMEGKPKKLTWGDAQKAALGLKNSYPDIPYEYAHAAVFVAHKKYTGRNWLPPEAKLFRKENPKIWNIIDYV